MKSDRRMWHTALIQSFSARNTQKVILSVVAFTVSTVFVVLACSALQNEAARTKPQQPSATDWKPVEQALGKAGSLQPGDVYKVGLPRTDLQVHRWRRSG